MVFKDSIDIGTLSGRGFDVGQNTDNSVIKLNSLNLIWNLFCF